jgi:hypothetical protein
MSVIRCLSNPEGLYIWSDGEYYSISMGWDWKHGNIRFTDCISVKEEVFHEACKAFNDCETEFVSGDFSVKEKEVEVISTGDGFFDRKSNHPIFPHHYIEIRKGDLWCQMWPITWEAIVNRVIERHIT